MEKRSFRKSKRSFVSGDRIDYRNMSLISGFISEQGKPLSRRANRLTLRQQRLTTIAIKQLERSESTAKAHGLRINN